MIIMINENVFECGGCFNGFSEDALKWCDDEIYRCEDCLNEYLEYREDEERCIEVEMFRRAVNKNCYVQ